MNWPQLRPEIVPVSPSLIPPSIAVQHTGGGDGGGFGDNDGGGDGGGGGEFGVPTGAFGG